MYLKTSKDGGHLFPKCKGAKGLWSALVLEELRVQLAVPFWRFFNRSFYVLKTTDLFFAPPNDHTRKDFS
jgi:hypothetical protein